MFQRLVEPSQPLTGEREQDGRVEVAGLTGELRGTELDHPRVVAPVERGTGRGDGVRDPRRGAGLEPPAERVGRDEPREPRRGVGAKGQRLVAVPEPFAERQLELPRLAPRRVGPPRPLGPPDRGPWVVWRQPLRRLQLGAAPSPVLHRPPPFPRLGDGRLVRPLGDQGSFPQPFELLQEEVQADGLVPLGGGEIRLEPRRVGQGGGVHRGIPSGDRVRPGGRPGEAGPTIMEG